MTTKSPEYDAMRARWAKETGKDYPPECEDCGADLTDKAVHDVGWGWVGDCCRDRKVNGGPTEEELRAHERRQMGLL